ncbi:unnamed protein product (macronuclear) [Paramecium tetraurelia]|uniref:Chromosome undetermined scaffold_168, whole genome shotgun sequence n=1 Tax=Paramecium tetraurelia TaxID=5888 RepID=Q3SDM3_PARTE|nr:uncharacterized protein GSPATT00037394001 [Paramecium tetraurelia]CAI39335.1 rab_B43 [Paramecium tetraurelia]CAK68609.1 unnamed protein product [Paramecium tetraurelia]|eukprot:XP_001436006.1 hypothetical protein (macronuclear) [Paramecium tetraurelia strain d4-2]
MEKIDILVKVVIIGDTTVGKTNIMTQYCDTNFKMNSLPTIGADSRVKMIQMNERETIKMMIWDTCGQERFKSITKNTFKGAQGFVLVTFEHVEGWLESIKDNIDTNTVSIVLVGNKSDLDELRQVSRDQGQTLANKHNLNFFETSAKLGINLSEVFISLARNIRKIINSANKDTEMLTTDKTKAQKKKGCC